MFLVERYCTTSLSVQLDKLLMTLQILHKLIIQKLMDYTYKFYLIFLTYLLFLSSIILSISVRIYVVTNLRWQVAMLYIVLYTLARAVTSTLYYLQNVGMLFVFVYDLYFLKQFMLSNLFLFLLYTSS